MELVMSGSYHNAARADLRAIRSSKPKLEKMCANRAWCSAAAGRDVAARGGRRAEALPARAARAAADLQARPAACCPLNALILP